MFANSPPPHHSAHLNTILPYDLNYIPEDIRRRAKSELFEDEDTRVHSLNLLKSMLKEEANLYWQDDELFLLAYLRVRKYDVKRAFNVVQNFYKTTKKHDELYSNFNYDDVRRTLKENIIGYLPYRDTDGCLILIIRAEPWDPHVNTLGDIMRALTCSLLHAILSPVTQVCGFKVIVDFSGCGITKLPHITPTYLWLFTEALQNCFPGRFKSIHMVNENFVINYVWSVLKQFLSKKIRDRFHFHGKNIKKLHKYFSPEILTAEFEGELPPFDNSEWAAKMAESSDYFSHVFSHGYLKKLK